MLSEKSGKKVRTLSLKGGGTIVEEQVARDEKKMDYTYAILESPLPVEGYRSTLSVAPDAKAEEVVGGIYDSGLKGISAKAK